MKHINSEDLDNIDSAVLTFADGEAEYADDIERFVLLIENMCARESLINLTFSKFPKGETLKVKAALKIISKAPVIQFEYFLTEGRVRQLNIRPENVGEELRAILSISPRQADFNGANISGMLLISKKGSAKLITKKQNITAVQSASGNDREKNYIFFGNEDFLTLLGISDKDGRIHDKKQAKFRQINRFCEQIRDIMKYLPSEGEIHIADLCCGKSYLSFAVYYYLTVYLKRRVEMTCIDLKQSVIDYCADIAGRLDYNGMSFLCMDINGYKPEKKIDLVISLHACDTATDIVIDFAIANGAKVILSTPCCQHELSELFNCKELDYIGRYPHLKQKFCSVATDALRLERLEAAGYKTDAIELIDPEYTPKNTLLRGILKSRNFRNTVKGAEKFDTYNEHYRYLTGREAKELPELI